MLPLRDHNPSPKKPVITVLLIAANLYGFFRELLAPDLENFIREYALIPASVDFGSPAALFPFLTSIFLHAGWFHLLSNMWFLWIFGDNVEERFGKIKYLLIYLLSGVIAGAAQYAVSAGSAVPMLGASGAVAGVLGAYLVFFPRHRVDTLVPIFFFVQIIPLPAYIMLGYWFITQIFAGVGSLAVQTAASGGVAFFAHVGGFIAGVFFAKLRNRGLTPVRRIWI